MPDTLVILVTGVSDHDYDQFTEKIVGKSNHGNFDIEYINRINQRHGDIFHHDFTININSKYGSEGDDILYITHSNFKRRSVVEKVLSKLTGLDVKLTEKPKKSDEKPFIYLDPEFCTVERSLMTKLYDSSTTFILKLYIIWELILMVFRDIE